RWRDMVEIGGQLQQLLAHEPVGRDAAQHALGEIGGLRHKRPVPAADGGFFVHRRPHVERGHDVNEPPLDHLPPKGEASWCTSSATVLAPAMVERSPETTPPAPAAGAS